MIRILLAEDNSDLRHLLKLNLMAAGYEVYEAGDGLEALDQLAAVKLHLIIVDVMMPRMDGFELTRTLREAKIDLPILLLTARETLADKRTGFKAGADDYLVKPVDGEELLLHVEALLRRAGMANQREMRVGDLMLSEENMLLRVKEMDIPLRNKEFQLLHLMLSYMGKIFTRQVLMDEIWGYDSETDPRTVDVHIKRLREKLALSSTVTIETVRGLGYRAVSNR